jgi:hypothetical protein
MLTNEVPRPPGISLSCHTSDVPKPSSSSPTMIHRTGVLRAACRDGTVKQVNLWMSDISIYQIVTHLLNKKYRYDKFEYTPFSTSDLCRMV